jgi:hypothetical protein
VSLNPADINDFKEMETEEYSDTIRDVREQLCKTYRTFWRTCPQCEKPQQPSVHIGCEHCQPRRCICEL